MYVTTYTVEGQGAFPVDMLRYNCSYPASTEDALAIVARSPGKVTLRTRHQLKQHHLTPDRWASFLWHITSSITRKL